MSITALLTPLRAGSSASCSAHPCCNEVIEAQLAAGTRAVSSQPPRPSSPTSLPSSAKRKTDLLFLLFFLHPLNPEELSRDGATWNTGEWRGPAVSGARKG